MFFFRLVILSSQEAGKAQHEMYAKERFVKVDTSRERSEGYLKWLKAYFEARALVVEVNHARSISRFLPSRRKIVEKREENCQEKHSGFLFSPTADSR